MIGKRIQEYRMHFRLKVGEFAKLIGISQGSLSDIENAKTKPSADTISAVVRNTDINPGWLLTGDGSMRKDDYRTGDDRPFLSSTGLDKEEIDHDLMWDVVNGIQRLQVKMMISPQDFPHDKRVIIQNLLYDDARQKNRQIDDNYAELLFRLTDCEVCEEAKRREKVLGPNHRPGEVSLLVKTPPGQICPMEGKPREYIRDKPVEVPDTTYYIRLIDDGSLILVDVKTTKDQTFQANTIVESQITQTIGGKSNKVAGRDFIEGTERIKK